MDREPDPTRDLILIFDGHCTMCNGWVKFVLKHERHGRMLFVARDSATGVALREQTGVPLEMETMVFVEDGRAWVKSDGTMQALRHLRAPWRWLRVLRFIPRPVRDWGYDIVAATRYRIFGRTEACALPSDEVRGRVVLD